jgi:DMSO/TMAO reductase YedYZ molybdopterin-dependent catalytic subunit
MSAWTLSLKVEGEVRGSFTWDELNRLERSSWDGDIHCVTRWSKFDTKWNGVRIDTILAAAGVATAPPFLLAVSMDGYSSNLLTDDVLGGNAMVATHFGGEPLNRHHGGPARLFVPKLYFWKSAKWLRELNFSETETIGFWESRGYHVYGDPWQEQRFDGE